METKAKTRPIRLRALVVTAMLSAVGCVLMMLDFPLPMLIPSFVKMDVSELPALLAAFSMGPVSGIVVCLMKNILAAIFHGSTLGIGEVCNFLMGAVFTGVAGLIYKHSKTRKMAVIARWRASLPWRWPACRSTSSSATRSTPPRSAAWRPSSALIRPSTPT